MQLLKKWLKNYDLKKQLLMKHHLIHWLMPALQKPYQQWAEGTSITINQEFMILKSLNCFSMLHFQ